MTSLRKRLAVRARGRAVVGRVRRIDLVGRAAYGTLCIGAMAALALPVIFIAGTAIAVLELADDDNERALAFWLGSWAAAAFAGALFLAIFYAAWPLASDWIMEWPGYATGFSIAGAWLALLAVLVLATPLPLFVSIPVSLMGAFATGFAVAGRLAGLKAPSARARVKARTLRRR